MIRVLIAEDSAVVQRVLVSLLENESGIKVVGVASNGLQAIQMCQDLRPDLVTMDIYMPVMDGLEATRRILKEYPTRIIIISSIVDSEGLIDSFDAIRRGAIEVIEKPHGVLMGDYSNVKRSLVKKIKEIALAAPERHLSWLDKDIQGERTIRYESKKTIVRKSKIPSVQIDLKKSYAPKIICIGGSTGAPAVIQAILANLSSEYPSPILVAQHIAPGFLNGMVSWLTSTLRMKVKIAITGDKLNSGQVLVAPDDAHLIITSREKAAIIKPAPNDTHTPSIDLLFDSIADIYGEQSVGILLSGMGTDGVSGLQRMYKRKAITLVQSQSTSLINGMPGTAIARGAAKYELSPSEIAGFLQRFDTE